MQHLKNALGSSVQLPSAAVGRMSLYLRELQRLSDNGVMSLNSAELATLIEVSPAVVRRDLSTIGAIGRRGVGYVTADLIQSIGAVLGSETSWTVALVGVGSLGTALLRYRGLQRQGFHIVAAFDADPRLVGTSICGVPIYAAAEMSKKIGELKPQLAVLAVPAEAATAVASELADAGITGILNFAPATLKLPKEMGVVNVDLASEMQRLAFTVTSGITGGAVPEAENQKK
ncbi:MAG TPA: redox-sensing transcriptional repressor Rex [Planctomycetaceae bacterium]|nr:redox-sensing transcriptional repressor Rex [Planctomycetaceae bacterium]